MRKRIRALLIIALSIMTAVFLSSCGGEGTGGRLGGGIDGGTPGGGLPEPVAGTLSGSVWLDYNQNGIIDPGEPGIPDINVDLYFDSNGNGSFDLFSDELISSTTTDSNGDYSFTVDSTDRYFISIYTFSQPAIYDLLLTTTNDAPEWAGPPTYQDTLIVDITNLNAGIKDLNFGFFNPTKWGFDISPNGSPIDIISSSAIAPDGTIYVGSGNGALYAVNPNGTLKWQYQTGGDLTGSPAIGSDGTVYIGSYDRQIYAINPEGTLQWVFPTDTVFTSSPAIASDGTIYIAGTNLDDQFFCPDGPRNSLQLSKLFALNQNGTLKWVHNVIAGEVHSSPAIAKDGTIYIGSTGSFSVIGTDPCTAHILDLPSDVNPNYPTGGHLYAINPDGTLIWDFKALGIVDSSPAIGLDGAVYVGSDAPVDSSRTSGFIYAINPSGGLIWNTDLFGHVKSSPTIGSDGTIYIGSDKNDVFALNPLDGSIKWVYPTLDDVKSSPAIASDGTISIGSNDGSLYILNPDGTLNTRYIKEDGSVNSSPSIGTDGTVYFATGGGSLFAIIRTSPLANTPWPKFRHDLLNTGKQPGTSDPNPPVVIPEGGLKWRYLAKDSIDSSPAIGSDGTIYVGSDDSDAADGHLYAINADGTLKWSFNAFGDVDSSPAVGSDGTIYFGSDDNHVFALNPDGSLKWIYPTRNNVNSSPAIGSDGTIYVGSDDWNVYAINPDGTLKWIFNTDRSPVVSSPAVGNDGTIYVGAQAPSKSLYAINPDGSLKWRHETVGERPIDSSPAIGSDGTIYVGTDNGASGYPGALYAVNPDGTVKWIFATGGDVKSSPAIGSDGTIYVGSDDRQFYAFNPDGTLKWVFPTSGLLRSSPALGSDGIIYVGGNDIDLGIGYLYAINPNGTEKWHYKTSGAVESSPSIGSDGTIYVGSDDAGLYAIKGSSLLANTPWPKFRHDLLNTGRK